MDHWGPITVHRSPLAPSYDVLVGSTDGVDDAGVLALAGHAAARTGLVTTADALNAIGADRPQRKRIVRAGRLVPVLRGIYAFDEAGELALAHAAVRRGGPGAIVTGLGAARWLGLRWVPPSERVHILIPAKRRRASSPLVLVRRAHDHHTVATWTRDGLHVATADRGVVDGSRELTTLNEVRGLVLGAVADGWCTTEPLRRLLATGAVGGTAHCRRAVLDAERGAASPPEAELIDTLLRRRVPFVANPELWLDGCLIGLPDVYLLGTGVGGELDSKERHGDGELLDATLQRHGRFADAALWLEHITPARFRRDPESYVDMLLARAAAHREPAGLRVVHRGPVLR